MKRLVGLVKRNSKMIGILVSDIRDQHYIEGAYIIEQEFLSRGYCSLIFDTWRENDKKSAYIRLLSHRKVEVAVFIGSTFQTDEVKLAIKSYLSDIPIVMAKGSLDLPDISSVIDDEQDGGTNIVRYLYSIGKRNIIYIDRESTPSNKIKKESYMATVSSFGLIPHVIVSENNTSGGKKTMDMVLDKGDVVDLIAVGALRVVFDRNLKLTNDISIIGIDNSPYASISTPSLSSLDTHLKSCHYVVPIT